MGLAARWILEVKGSKLLREAARLVVQGRIIYARRLGVDAFRVVVRGRGGVYIVEASRRGLRCTCPARGICKHIAAALIWLEARGVDVTPLIRARTEARTA